MKCQYMAHSSTLRRTRRRADPGADCRAPEHEKPAQYVQAMQSGDHVEEAVRWVIRQHVTRGRQLTPCQNLPGNKENSRNKRRGKSYVQHFEAIQADFGFRPLQRYAAGGKGHSIHPQQSRDRDTPPVGTAHAPEIGADEQRKQRADDGKEDAEPEFRFCLRRSAHLRRIACQTYLQPRLGGQSLPCHPPADDAADPGQENENGAHDNALSEGPAAAGWFCGRKSSAAPGTL